MTKHLYVVVLFVFGIQIFAQSGSSIGLSDPRSAAMGGSGTINSQGIYAVGNNPANLVKMRHHNFEIATILPIPNVGVKSNNDFISFSDINYYFGGVTNNYGRKVARELNDQEKNNLRSLFDDGTSIRTLTEINIFTIAYNAGYKTGTFAFKINDVSGQSSNLSTDLIDLALYGNEIGRKYSFDDISARAAYFREYSFSYANNFKSILPKVFRSFQAGLSLKLIRGFGYLELDNVLASVETLDDFSLLLKSDYTSNIAVSPNFGVEWDFENNNNSEGDFSPFPSPVGKGFGVDLGFSGQFDQTWSIALALTNIGSISWVTETVKYVSNGTFLIREVVDSSLTDSLEAKFKPVGSYSNGFTSNLPTTLSLGVGINVDYNKNNNIRNELLFVIEYHQGFNNEPGNSTSPRFALGVEWQPFSGLPIRSGFSIGGEENVLWGLGFGLDLGIWEFGIATPDIIGVLQGSNSKHVSVSFGSYWKF